MMKVMTILGTRPELIKMSRVIQRFDKIFDHCFVHTGQNYDHELNGIFYEDLGLRAPNHYLETGEGSLGQRMATVIEKVDAVLESEKPDAVVFYGDTNSCLGVIPAKRRHIPVFHLEAGNRCFDQRVPEEINRKIIDHLSDINFVHSEHARQYLHREGIAPQTVIRTGSPMKEILSGLEPKIHWSSVLKKLNLQAKSYFVVSFHREENLDEEKQFNKFVESLVGLQKRFQKPILVSTHPRTQKRLDLENIKFPDEIQFLKPLGIVDYWTLQKQAFCVLSDSGTLTEEASLLGFPGVMIRRAHERPEGMDYGVTVMSDLDLESLSRSIQMVTESEANPRVESIPDYHNPFFSEQVTRCVQSYVGYVNRTVWQKDV